MNSSEWKPQQLVIQPGVAHSRLLQLQLGAAHSRLLQLVVGLLQVARLQLQLGVAHSRLLQLVVSLLHSQVLQLLCPALLEVVPLRRRVSTRALNLHLSSSRKRERTSVTSTKRSLLQPISSGMASTLSFQIQGK